MDDSKKLPITIFNGGHATHLIISLKSHTNDSFKKRSSSGYNICYKKLLFFLNYFLQSTYLFLISLIDTFLLPDDDMTYFTPQNRKIINQHLGNTRSNNQLPSNMEPMTNDVSKRTYLSMLNVTNLFFQILAPCVKKRFDQSFSILLQKRAI